MLLKIIHIINSLKKITLLIQAKNEGKKKMEDVDKKMDNTSEFIETQNFNRLTKVNFNAKSIEKPCH